MGGRPDAPRRPWTLPRALGAVLRRLGRALLLTGLLLLLLLLLGAQAAARSERVVRFLLVEQLPLVNEILPGRILLNGVGGTLRDGLVLDGVFVYDENDELAARADRIELSWQPWDLLTRTVGIDSLRVVAPDVTVAVRQDGSVNLAAAFVPPGPKPPKPEKAGGSPVDVHVRRVLLEGGRVRVLLPGKEPMLWEGIGLDGAWALDDEAQEISLREFRARPRAPLDVAELRMRAVATLAEGRLDLDYASLGWKENRLLLEGTLGPLRALAPDLRIRSDRLDLVDVRDLAPSAPVDGRIAALDLHVGGNLQVPEIKGTIDTEGGGHVDVEAWLDRAAQPVAHGVKLRLTNFSPAEILARELKEAASLPQRVGFSVDWNGRGLRAQELKGGGPFVIEPLQYSGVEIGRQQATLRLEGLHVFLDDLAGSVAGVTLSGDVDSDIPARSFAAALDLSSANLRSLSGLTKGTVHGGSVQALVRAGGSWGAPKDPNVLRAEIETRLGAARLAVASVLAGTVTADAKLELLIPKGEKPSVRGPATVRAMALDVAGKRQVERATLEATLDGPAATFAFSASREPELLAKAKGRVDWSAAPTLALHGDSVSVLLGDFLAESKAPFDLKTREGAVQLDGMQLDLGPGTLIAQALYEPGGTVRGSVRVQGADLERLERHLPKLLDATGAGAEGPAPAPPELGLFGSIKELKARLSGTLAAPELELDLALRDFRARGRGPLTVDLHLESKAGHLLGQLGVAPYLDLQVHEIPATFRFDGGGTPFQLDADGAWDARLTLAQRPLKELAALVGRPLPEALSGGEYRGGLTWEGTTRAPELRAAVSVSDVNIAERQVQAALVATIEGGQLGFSDSVVKTAAEGRVLEIRGRAGAPLGDWLLAKFGPESARGTPPPLFTGLELGARMVGLDLALAHGFVPALKPLTGKLRGDVTLGGELAQPRIVLSLETLDAAVGRQALSKLELLATAEAGRLGTALLVRAKEGGELKIETQGGIPLRLPLPEKEELLGSPDLRGTVSGRGFPLALLTAFVPGVIDTRGELAVDGTIAGSLLRPVPDIHARLEGARLCHAKTSVCYEELALAADWTPELLQLEELAFRTVPQARDPFTQRFGPARILPPVPAEGTFRLSASARLDGLSPKWTEANVELGHAWASYTEEIQGTVDGKLKLSGYWPALRVTGDLTMNHVKVDIGQEDVGQKTQAMELPDNVVVHRSESRRGPGERKPSVAEAAAAGAEREPTSLERLKEQLELDVRVRLGNSVRAKVAVGIAGQRNDAARAVNLFGRIDPDLVLQGDVDVSVRRGRPSLVGRVTVGHGSTLTVMNKRFDVELGSAIELVGKVPDSQLQIRAVYNSRYGPLTVAVTNRLASPTIDFESAVFSDDADILSVLVTGKPLSELSTAEGTRTLSSVGATLAGFTAKTLGRFAPVDMLDVDFGNDVSSGSAEAGKALGSRVYLIVRFRWGTQDDKNTIEAQVEVQIARDLYFQVRMGDKVEGAGEIVWKSRF